MKNNSTEKKRTLSKIMSEFSDFLEINAEVLESFLKCPECKLSWDKDLFTKGCKSCDSKLSLDKKDS